VKQLCGHCGSKAPADADKCPNCGSTDLRPAAAEVPAKVPSRGSPVVAVAGVAVALAIACCVCGSLVSWRSGPSAPVMPPAQPVAVAASARGFDAVRARGALHVGVDPNAPPFLQKTAEGWEGFEYALISAVGESAKVSVSLEPMVYGDLLDAVSAGRVDLAVAQLPPQNRSGVSFSRSYLQYTLCLVVRADERAKALGDLNGRVVGSYDDPSARGAIQAAGAGIRTKLYEDAGYFGDLAGGRIDAMLYDCPLARYELRTDPAGPKLRIADERVAVATYSIAVSDATPGLREDVDAVLTDLGASGLFGPLAARWLGGAPADVGIADRILVVAPGEDLAAVAARAGVTASDLATWNADILGSGAPAVYGGMLLRLR
jgi:ABC-type amino acid transport substrate-binding protein/ribosomal protein L40E